MDYFFLSVVGAVFREITDFLVTESFEMARLGLSEKKVKNDSLEGKLVNSFKTVLIGALSGTRFSAEIESSLGEIKADFVINNQAINQYIQHHKIRKAKELYGELCKEVNF